MKTRITIIIILFLCNILYCQAQTVWLYTPEGHLVYAFERAEMSAADITYYTAMPGT